MPAICDQNGTEANGGGNQALSQNPNGMPRTGNTSPHRQRNRSECFKRVVEFIR
jgi:hypothetical protein